MTDPGPRVPLTILPMKLRPRQHYVRIGTTEIGLTDTNFVSPRTFIDSLLAIIIAARAVVLVG